MKKEKYECSKDHKLVKWKSKSDKPECPVCHLKVDLTKTMVKEEQAVQEVLAETISHAIETTPAAIQPVQTDTTSVNPFEKLGIEVKKPAATNLFSNM